MNPITFSESVPQTEPDYTCAQFVTFRYKYPYAGVNAQSEEGSDLQKHIPPWRFVVAALAGIVGTSVGWGNLRNGRRKITSTIILLLGLAIWSYAVVVFLNWNLRFWP